MPRKVNPVYVFLILSLLSTATTFFLLWQEVNNINENDLQFYYPANRIEALIFLSKPLFLLTPFLLTITIFGSYILTKLWVKDIIINIVSETYEKKATSHKIKILTEDEKKVLKILIENKSEILQSDLVKKSNISKYKITRILNGFEQSNFIKREKYGITNIIHLLINPNA
jgi:uncharacterized membrane protein